MLGSTNRHILFFAMFFLSASFSVGLRTQLTKNFGRLPTMSASVRPTLDDVERISRGQAAKRRGTGSRAVPHRLNAAERVEWELAKKRKFLLLRGTGWRKERGASPLANIYRQYCDATMIPCISMARGLSSQTIVDEVSIDFSPLRVKDVSIYSQLCREKAADLGTLVEFIDHSDIDAQGWNVGDISLEEDVIWRLPVYCCKASFADRRESRYFVALMAHLLTGAAKPKDLSATIDELDFDDFEEDVKVEGRVGEEL